MPTLSLSKNQGSRAGTRDIYHILAVCAARDCALSLAPLVLRWPETYG